MQGRSGMMKSADTNRVRTVLDPLDLSARRAGTPLHKFWALHAQMFHDDAIIRIVPQELSISLAFFVALSIVLILQKFGALYSLVAFLILSCAGPVLNVLAIRNFQIYCPIFDTLYAGFLTFLLATFAKLSIESFYHWRLRIQQVSDSELLSAKSNFISLLSHNLNTPVAKMQGILTAIESCNRDEALHKDLREAHRLVSSIQISIRSVLAITSMEENELNSEALVFESFLESFRESMSRTFKRLGLSIQLELVDNELAKVPIRFDRRALTMGIVSFLILLADIFKKDSLHLVFQMEESESPDLQLSCQVQGIDAKGLCFHEAMEKDRNHETLLQELASTVFKNFMKLHKGEVLASEQHLTLLLHGR